MRRVSNNWLRPVQVACLLCLIWILGISGCMLVLGAETNVIVTSYDVSPDVIMPGDKALVTATISYASPDGTYEMIDDPMAPEMYPVIESVYLNGKNEVEVIGGNSRFSGSIGPGQSVPVSFLIQAPVKSGVFFPELLIRVRDRESIKFPIAINVNTQVKAVRQPALILVQDEMIRIRPGEDLNLTLSLSNEGRSRAEDITIRVMEQEPDIAPRITGAYHMTELPPDSRKEMTLAMRTDREAAIGIREIPLLITYMGPDGKVEELAGSVSFHLSGEAEPGITALSTEPVRLTKGEIFSLIIRIENTGTGDARSVTASIDLPFEGNLDAFVGTIEPDNDAPAVFSLKAGDPGMHTYTLTVTYSDDWGEHRMEKELRLYVDEEVDNSGFIALILILVIGVGGGYWFWSRRSDRQ